MKSSLRLGDRARPSDRFLAKTGSAPRLGTIVERYSGSYGLLEEGPRRRKPAPGVERHGSLPPTPS